MLRTDGAIPPTFRHVREIRALEVMALGMCDDMDCPAATGVVSNASSAVSAAGSVSKQRTAGYTAFVTVQQLF